MGSARLRGAVVGVVLALAALAPVPASASVGQPIALGPGQTPNVTVEGDGTAHIAWRGSGNDSRVLQYCRLPRDARACAPQTTVNAPGDSIALPLAFGDGTTVRVISSRYGGDVQATYGSFGAVLMFTSTDGGASFGPGTKVGSAQPVDYAFGPGSAVSGVTGADACGLCYQAFPLGGGEATGPAVLSTTHPYNSSVAMIDPNTPIAVFAAGSGQTQFRRYSGVGDVNDAANWTPPVDVAALDYNTLVSGPSGVFLVSADTFVGRQTVVRRFNGSTFGAPVTVSSEHTPRHATEDGSGRLHIVNGGFLPSARSGSGFFYASSDDGVRWLSQYPEFPFYVGNPRVAVAPDHYGVVVGSDAGGGSGVFAAPIGPAAADPTTGRFVGTTLVSGTVLIRVPGSSRFVALRRGDVVPVGTLVDATNGRVRITIALPNGRLQSADFSRGVFRVAQARTGLATMALAGGNFRAVCGRGGARAAQRRKSKIVRQLWADGSGKFRTRGRYAAATIRGTAWSMQDRCDGTLTRVTAGRVAVADLRRDRVVVLRRGQSYLAGARR